MSASQSSRTTGERLRACRRYRGMSQRALAGLAGVSPAFVSMVENGQRTLERRAHLAALADALHVSISELTGQPIPPTAPANGTVHALVPAVRTALLGHTLDHAPALAPRPARALAEAVEAMASGREHCRDESTGRELVELLPELHAAALRGDDPQTALRALVMAAKVATSWAKALGYHDLAWIAADRGRQAALRLESPLHLAAADYSVAQALSGLGAHDQIGAVVERACASVPRETSQDLQVYGMLLLTAALNRSVTGAGDPDAALDEARDVAARTGEGTVFRFAFGPTNVAQWSADLAMDRGDAGRAARIAQGIDPARIASDSRRAAYWSHRALALARLRGQEGAAAAAFRHAEALAPDRLRASPQVRDTLLHLLARAPRPAARDLRGIAHRAGVPL
ncbi:MAG: hypothetical protein QG622_3185 [Actinomycetota bacterium]|nr:hypothetical protein [Actinomycetota bacterium]